PGRARRGPRGRAAGRVASRPPLGRRLRILEAAIGSRFPSPDECCQPRSSYSPVRPPTAPDAHLVENPESPGRCHMSRSTVFFRPSRNVLAFAAAAALVLLAASGL